MPKPKLYTTEYEVWEVEIYSEDSVFPHTYRVFATTASEAEQKGLAIAVYQVIDSPYCTKATFLFYVEA